MKRNVNELGKNSHPFPSPRDQVAYPEKKDLGTRLEGKEILV
jgi:hypothetical protein